MFAGIAGAIVSGLMNVLPDFIIKYMGLKNDALRIQADEIIERRRLQRDVLIAEQGRWYTALIRPMFAWPLAIWWAKVILYDKVLGMGTTDPLTGQVGEWAGLIVGAYFLAEAGERITAKIVNRKR